MYFQKSLVQACLISGLCFAMPFSLLADFQYTETTKITGGSFVGMMKFAAALCKRVRKATEPITSNVTCQGTHKASTNTDTTQFVDHDTAQ